MRVVQEKNATLGIPTQKVAPTHTHVVWHNMQPSCWLSSHSCRCPPWRGAQGANALLALCKASPYWAVLGSDLHFLPSEPVLCWHRFLRWGHVAAAASSGKLLSVQTQPQAEAQVMACSPVQGAGRAVSESWPACSKATLLQQQATHFLPILTGPSGQMMQASCWVSGSWGGGAPLVLSISPHPQLP